VEVKEASQDEGVFMRRVATTTGLLAGMAHGPDGFAFNYIKAHFDETRSQQ
jgi:hypothetical protein